MKKTQKIKIVQLHEKTPKQCFNPDLTLKIAHYGPKKSNDPKLESNLKVRNESCSTKLVDPKTVFELYTNPKNSPLRPQKVKNDPKNSPLGQKVKNEPKIMTNSKVSIEENIKNQSC